MIDLDVLKKYKLDRDSLKAIFGKPSYDELPDKIKPLVLRMRDRIQKGRDFNWENYRLYYALDLAWDSSFQQITPTLLSSLIDKGGDDETILSTLKSWGLNLNEIMQESPDPKTPGQVIKKVSVPAFFRVFVPLVKSYVTIRWAKMMNDRRLVPFFKFDPAISDHESQLRCAAITSIVETIATEMGYYDVMKQSVFRELHYGECLQFPVEEWYKECQLAEADSDYAGEKVDGPDGEKFKEITVKAGLRYHQPHPTRTFYDRGFGPSTFNSDTGCAHAGYWHVVKYSQIMANADYWNLDKIGYEDFNKWMRGKSYDYFKNVMQGCAIDFPTSQADNAGTSKYDSERHQCLWYTSDMADKPVVLTEYFEKLVPKDNGMGDYPYPVWFRFVIAADCTVLYCAPLPYSPVIFYGYDQAEGRTLTAGMSLEILPFQDQFTNLLSQYLLTVRQNLMNLSFIDTDILDEEDAKKLDNFGEKWYRRINIIRASFKRMIKGGNNPAAAVVSHKFPIQDTTALLNAMKVILDTCERVLGVSNQEVGQAASHEQTREEVRNIKSGTSTRVTFTGTTVDIAKSAWKRQLYQAVMAYGEEDFIVQIPMEEEIPKSDLEKLGFTYGDSGFDPKTRKAKVHLKKTAIALASFASDRDGDDRINDAQTAQAMIQFFDRFSGNPALFQAVGADEMIKFANTIARFSGFPRDFKLVKTGESPDQQQQAIMQQLGQYVDEVRAKILEEVKGAITSIVQDSKQTNDSQNAELEHLNQEITQLAQVVGSLAKPPPAPPAIAPFPQVPAVAPSEFVPPAAGFP